MKLELKFDNEFELKRFQAFLKVSKAQLEDLEYIYGGPDLLYTDLAIVDSVINQIEGIK